MAKLDVTYAYAADIVKSERDPETGDLMVYGKATGPDLDLDGQICDPAWLKTAMPKWMEWGNIREMHGPIAAGVGVQLDEVGDDWYVTARIVDPGTAAKVEAGVLKGFSIGIKSARVVKDSRAPNGRINGGDIVENSLVDRPCNPTAKMSICKAAGLAEDGHSIEVEDGVETPLLPVEAEDETPGGPSVERGDYGSGRAPVVEDPAAGMAKVLGADLQRRLRAVVPEMVDISKAVSGDIATAQQAIAVIAGLIQSEAAGLAAGNMCEAEQISCLLRAVDALTWFQCMEANEPPAPAEGGDNDGLDAMAVAATNDMDVNGAVITMVLDGNKINESLIGKIDKGATIESPVATESTTDLVKAAVAEAMREHEAEIATLRAQLTKAMAMPLPGGPVLARPRAVIAQAGEREATLVKAEQYESMSRALMASDPPTARAYANEAATLRRSARTSHEGSTATV